MTRRLELLAAAALLVLAAVSAALGGEHVCRPDVVAVCYR